MLSGNEKHLLVFVMKLCCLHCFDTLYKYNKLSITFSHRGIYYRTFMIDTYMIFVLYSWVMREVSWILHTDRLQSSRR